jgi:dTDP-4-dehydrorhamnose 3,5-epimerase-like enzyme
MDAVRIIQGGIFSDHRGSLRHANSFDLKLGDRFYTIHPARVGDIRGWVGHKRDWKWFFPVTGSFDIGVVAPDVWHAPDRNSKVFKYTLNAQTPCILELPPGYYFASRCLEEQSTLLVFSSGRIETASEDDYRLAPDYWQL